MTKEIEYDKLIKLINKNICIELKYFYKQKDYTILIKNILNVINQSLEKSDKFNIIINCKDYSVLQTDVEFINHLIQFLQETYDDKLQYMYFINFI